MVRPTYLQYQVLAPLWIKHRGLHGLCLSDVLSKNNTAVTVLPILLYVIQGRLYYWAISELLAAWIFSVVLKFLSLLVKDLLRYAISFLPPSFIFGKDCTYNVVGSVSLNLKWQVEVWTTKNRCWDHMFFQFRKGLVTIGMPLKFLIFMKKFTLFFGKMALQHKLHQLSWLVNRVTYHSVYDLKCNY